MSDEIATCRSMSVRERLNPPEIKCKMSNFNVRHRGELLHQKREPVPVLII
jgi:hypothetical protein